MDSMCCVSQLYGPSFIWNTIPNTLRTPAVLDEIWILIPRNDEDNACTLKIEDARYLIGSTTTLLRLLMQV